MVFEGCLRSGCAVAALEAALTLQQTRRATAFSVDSARGVRKSDPADQAPPVLPLDTVATDGDEWANEPPLHSKSPAMDTGTSARTD
ncbi:hypothetical protein MTO96_050939 [Rhipicephalus appendiculatus]